MVYVLLESVLAYQLAAMTLAGTDIDMKARYERALSDYRARFNEYVEKNQSESGQVGGVMISIGCEEGVNITHSRDNSGLDLSDRPVFAPPEHRLEDVVEPILADFGLLSFGILLAFAGSFVSFMRYDLR